ncbi:META domain-containing protein [Sulfitobacter sediminilitoris]
MRFSIFGGCNRFIGDLALSEGTIAFPESFAGTLMACPDDVERHERAFLDALARVHSYVRYGTGLVLTDRSGGALLHFVERHD